MKLAAGGRQQVIGFSIYNSISCISIFQRSLQKTLCQLPAERILLSQMLKSTFLSKVISSFDFRKRFRKFKTFPKTFPEIKIDFFFQLP